MFLLDQERGDPQNTRSRQWVSVNRLPSKQVTTPRLRALSSGQNEISPHGNSKAA
jgi:hypothetical protein